MSSFHFWKPACCILRVWSEKTTWSCLAWTSCRSGHSDTKMSATLCKRNLWPFVSPTRWSRFTQVQKRLWSSECPEHPHGLHLQLVISKKQSLVTLGPQLVQVEGSSVVGFIFGSALREPHTRSSLRPSPFDHPKTRNMSMTLAAPPKHSWHPTHSSLKCYDAPCFFFKSSG